MIDFYARRCRSCRRRAAVRQRCFRLTRRALRAHRFGGCSPAHRGDALLSTRSDARRSTNGTTARLRLLGRELARAQQLPPPRAPRAQTAAPTIFVRQSDAESVGGCKNEKNEDSEKATLFFSLDLLILLSVHLVRCRSAPLGGFRRVSCVPADTPLPSLPVFSCVDFPLLSIVVVLVLFHEWRKLFE